MRQLGPDEASPEVRRDDDDEQELPAGSESGVPNGHRLCPSCLVCFPNDEYPDEVICRKAVLLGISVSLQSLRVWHQRGFIVRSRELEQLQGSGVSSQDRDDELLRALALRGLCPSAFDAAREAAANCARPRRAPLRARVVASKGSRI